MISLQTFLRRTAATAGAIAALMVMGPATSQTVKLSTGALICPDTYADLSVKPNGNVTVTCGGPASSGPASSSPGTFSLVAPAQLAINAPSGNAVYVRRSGGSMGQQIVSYNVVSNNNNCINATGTVMFPDSSAADQVIAVQALATGICTVSITPPPGTAGSPTSTSINIVNALAGPVAGCPVETTAGTLGSAGFGNDVRLASGEIATFTLPTLGGVSTMANTGFFYTAQSTPNTDNGGFFSIEMHINKCKGLVQATTGSKCYGVISNPVGGEIKWLKAFTAKYTSEAIATTAGYCYAPASEGPWYLNVRYNYPQGCNGTTKCGWTVVWRPLN